MSDTQPQGGQAPHPTVELAAEMANEMVLTIADKYTNDPRANPIVISLAVSMMLQGMLRANEDADFAEAIALDLLNSVALIEEEDEADGD
jgi:isocitrate/isopropylmalate dehydrogenase